MNKYVEYMDRYYAWRNDGFEHEKAKNKAIGEMLVFGIIESPDEIWDDAWEYLKDKPWITKVIF